MDEKIAIQMRKGVLEYAVLALINQQELYASQIIETLKTHNLIVVEGTLYPLLSRLKSDGLLSYSRVESTQGPPRKYYTITESGKASLSSLRSAWKLLVTTMQGIDHEFITKQ